MNVNRTVAVMEITQSCQEDIEAILALYDEATALQASKGMTQWPKIDRTLVESEVAQKRQWKMTVGDEIVCVWVVAYSDPQIWGERDVQPSLFIHRIANHPLHRGQGFVGKIVLWAKEHCGENSLRFVRLDTVGYNEALIALYTRHGFTLLEPVTIEDPTGLPSHYHEDEVYLFEIDLQ